MSFAADDESEEAEMPDEKLQSDYNLAVAEVYGSSRIHISSGVDDASPPVLDAAKAEARAPKKAAAKRKKPASAGAAAPIPLKKRANAKKPTPVSKIAKLRETHKRNITKQATATLEAAFDAYAGSSLKEAQSEAVDQVQRCQDELRRIRANLRTTANAPAALRAHAQAAKRMRDSASDSPLLNECADVIEQQSRELRRLEQCVERLAESFSKNSSRCLAVTRIAGDSISRPAIDIVCTTTGSALSKSTDGAMVAYKELAPSNNEALVARVNESGGVLARIGDHEHPKMAMKIGADGKAVIGISTRPSHMLIEGRPGANYITFSVAREDAPVQSRVQAHGLKRISATRRVAHERQQNENRVRQMLALEQDAAMAALPPLIGAPVPILQIQ